MNPPQLAEPKALLDVLEHRIPKRRPIWFMRQAGRYLPEYRAVRERAGSFLDLCYSPELAAEVTLQPLRRFDVDAAILFADILLVPQRMGLGLDFVQNEGPQLQPVRTARDVSGLDADNAVVGLSRVFETVSLVRERLPAGVALIGFCGGPWTVASYMIEGGSSPDRSLTRKAAYEAEWFGELIDKLVRVSVDYLVGQVRCGAEVLQIFDSWAGDLPPGLRQRWCDEPIRRIVQGIKAAGCNVPVIGFARGIGAGQIAFASHTGVDAVGLEASVPMRWAVEAIADGVALQGNIDPVAVVVGGKSLEMEVMDLVDAVPSARHIVNLGHGIRPETPAEHVAAVVNLIRRTDRFGG